MMFKDNKGSITIFVLVGLLFMSAFLLISYGHITNKSKVAKEQFNMISGIYSPNKTHEESYKDAYTDLRNKNRQTLTTFSENTKVLELTKTFETDLENYRIYGNSVQESKLPSEYQQVEYIESTGTQYINTNYTDVSDTRIELDFVYTGRTSTTASSYMGANGGNVLAINSSGYFAINAKVTNVIPTEGSRYKITSYRDANNNRSGTINGVEFIGTSASQNQPYFIMALGNLPGNNKIYGKVYSCKIYYQNVIVRDFIPCYRKSDGVIGLYDLVNGVFYTNAGTGTFKKGSNAPTPEVPIEVESVGDKTKNLLNIKDGHVAGSTIEYTSENQVISKKSLTYVETSYLLQLNAFDELVGVSKLKAGTYIWNVYDVSGVTITNPYIVLTTSTGTINWNANTPITLTEEATITQVRSDMLKYPKDSTQQFRIQIEKGEVATEYEPYGYKIPVKVRGKNLCDPNQEIEIINEYYVKKYDLPAGTYTISAIGNVSVADYISVMVVDSNNTLVNSYGYIVNGNLLSTTNKTVTLKNGQSIILRHSTNKTTNTTVTVCKKSFDKFSWQIEEGNLVTDYTPYVKHITTNIYLNEPLRKIGDYADYIDLKTGKVVRNVHNEFITIVNSKSSLSGTYAIFLTEMDNKPLVKNSGNNTIGFAISNKFVQHKNMYKDLVENGGYIQPYVTSKGIVTIAYSFNDATIKTVEQAQEKIGDGFDISYILATPTEETIEIPKIKTLEDYTKIEVLTDILPSKIEATYQGYTLE